MSIRDKWVRRFSIDETAKHKNGFTIYKITSVLFPISSPEAVTVVSVWKRYSEVQQLHKSMKSLHAGLHLRGTFPALAKSSFFKRFNQEVIDERAKTIKALLEFVADHRLLFTSTDFVNFFQTGYSEPENKSTSIINAIRSSLHLPIEETPPLEYQNSDDEARSPDVHVAPSTSNMQTDIDISQIPIYKAAEVEMRESPRTSHKLSDSNSFESIDSIESLDSDLYEELSKVAIDKQMISTVVKRNVLPDLINFDVPSTSRYETIDSDRVSLASTVYDSSSTSNERGSRMSLYSKKSALSPSNAECKTRTEDSYVFEAGYLLNLAARCENMGDYQKAFDCYKSGIEKMLIGVQTDTDPQRRALIKEKTNKYLSYAEAIYNNHLCNIDQSSLAPKPAQRYLGVPLAMLRRAHGELATYRVLGVLGHGVMLVLSRADQACYALKVIQKIPNNLTEFDDYVQQRNNETRQPILPTLVPYMVPLHGYIETNNLIFLILSYAPGQKLFDYIKNYAKSIPNTPARELNLENVFSEPKKKDIDIQNDNVDVPDSVSRNDSKSFDSLTDLQSKVDLIDNSRRDTEDVNENKTDSLDIDLSVNELVINSQKLLLNIDKALTDVPRTCDFRESSVTERRDGEEKIEHKKLATAKCNKNKTNVGVGVGVGVGAGVGVSLPAAAVRAWGAQLLCALHALHVSGVVCGDLNSSNILLGEGGQIILTYMVGYCSEVTAGRVRGGAGRRVGAGRAGGGVAPELRRHVYGEVGVECDYWSYGAIMYELICGYPLPPQHGAWSGASLPLPELLPLEAASLLEQLLTHEPSERLGSGKNGIEEIKQHPYFKNIDWDHIRDSWIVPG